MEGQDRCLVFYFTGREISGYISKPVWKKLSEKKIRFLRGLLHFTQKARRNDGNRCEYIPQQKDKVTMMISKI